MKQLTDFSLKGMQHGHRQAMSKTFLRLKTRPEEYTPDLKKCYFDEVTHCELCGAALTYSFNLMHCEDGDFSRKLSLRVGADCIYNFCEAYMPGSAEQILYTIQEAMADSKVNKFKKDNPHIFELNEQIKKTLSSLRTTYGYSVQRLQSVIRFPELTRELTRQQYLSKPKVLYIETLGKMLESKDFQKMLLEHKNHKPMGLSEYLKTADKNDKKFYEKFMVLAPSLNMNNSQTISSLEQRIFTEQLSIKLTKISPEWVKQVQTTEGLFLISQPKTNTYGDVPYLSGLFQKFHALRPDQLETIKNHLKVNKIKKPLTKLPKVWHNIVKELISKNEI